MFAAFLEIREKRVPHFKNKKNLDLLASAPLPQDYPQYVMGRSLFKRVCEEYVPQDETVEIQPVKNVARCFAGKATIQLREKNWYNRIIPADDYVIQTDLCAGSRCAVDETTLASLYSTVTSTFITGERSGQAEAVELDVSQYGVVHLTPAPQAPLPMNFKQVLCKFFGADSMKRSHLRSPISGGHPILEFVRTLNQS